MSKPVILVVNDDGYEAKGLVAMVEIARSFGEVVVVTPDQPRSGVGHSITFIQPLRLHLYKEEDGIQYWRTNGTPVDCVKLGQKVIFKDRPIDLVLSGINHGSNSSVSVIYSGTMGAAIEASFENKAIGLSLLDYSKDADFTAAIHYGKKIVAEVLKRGLPPFTSLNVNIPKGSIDDIKGIRIARQTNGIWHEELVENTDPFGGKYYWLTGYLEVLDKNDDCCENLLKNHYISVQPVQYDMTAYRYMNDLKFLEDVR